MSDRSSGAHPAHILGPQARCVTTITDPLAEDPGLPAVAVLLGGEAADVLAAALAPSGAELRSAAPIDISWWPGDSITVAYSAEVAAPDGTRSWETLVAAAGDSVPEGALLLDGGPAGTVGVWRAPFDPALPGFAPALDPRVLAALLADLGVAADPRSLSTRVRSYRPGRRAVIEVSGTAGRIFCKVVRPHKAEGIHRRHRHLRPHLEVPTSHGFSAEHGVVVLEALPGDTLRDLFATDDDRPDPAQVVALLDALPEPFDGATAWGWRAAELGGIVAASVPELSARVGELVDRLERAEAALDPVEHPAVPVHGDLHDAQLLVQDGRVTGMLDIDTHASGRRLDDLATMVGHLSTLAMAVPHGEAVRTYARSALGLFDRTTDPVALRRAVAAVVLGLATGPFRVVEDDWRAGTEARIELAEMWLDSADELDAG